MTNYGDFSRPLAQFLDLKLGTVISEGSNMPTSDS